MPDKKPKIKLPSLSVVKTALFGDWALRVKQRDGWECKLCGGTNKLTTHHWYVCDHHAHAARYCIHNGVALCYACHIRGVHTRADWTTVQRLRAYVSTLPGFDENAIQTLAKTELTTELLRRLWDEMRARPVMLDDYEACVDVRGKKLFLSVDCRRPIAVAGNTVVAPGYGLCEVATVAALDAKTTASNLADSRDAEGNNYRYTLRKIDG